MNNTLCLGNTAFLVPCLYKLYFIKFAHESVLMYFLLQFGNLCNPYLLILYIHMVFFILCFRYLSMQTEIYFLLYTVQKNFLIQIYT